MDPAGDEACQVCAGGDDYVLYRGSNRLCVAGAAGDAAIAARSPIFWMLAIAAMMNFLVLLPHIGLTVNGARRWLPVGPVQVQPSELAKWAVVFFLAYWLTHRPVNLDKFFTGFLPTMIPIAGICLLVVVQDFGTATLIAVTGAMT